MRTAAALLVFGCLACAASPGPSASTAAPDAEGYVSTRSGLRYRVISHADGPRPRASDRVVVHYRSRREDGTVIDSSHDRGEPDVVALRDLIPGFREALLLMPVGSHFQVVVPGRLGYGWDGIPGMVGPNETLFFDIQLFGIAGDQAGAAAYPRNAPLQPPSPRTTLPSHSTTNAP